MSKRQIYAAYAGEKYVMDGTASEIAKGLGLAVATVRKLASPSYQARQSGLQIVKLGKEELGATK